MKSYDETNSYEEITEKLNIGDIVSFKSKNFSFINIKGEVKDFYFKKNRFFLKVYSYYKREEITFILSKDLKLIDTSKLKKRKKTNLESSYYYYNYSKSGPIEKNNRNLSFKAFALIIAVIFLLTTIPDFKLSFVSTSYEYNEFLKKKLSIYKLYSIVTKRINYMPDINDEWMSPQFAWDNRFGDCEEYANIISDYLNHHTIENYVTGLNLKNKSEGHAVIFVKKDNIFYILDPTRAVEEMGIKKLNNINALKDAIRLYSSLPVSIYKVPSKNYEKEIIETIYP